MSATNRGTKREAADFYSTPLESFEPLIPYLPKPPRTIMEPAMGDGRLVDAMCRAGLSARGNDLQNGYDFLQDSSARECIVTNPPYSLAFEFVKHAWNFAPEVFMLLRLNFLASQKRQAWFKDHRPAALFVLSKRPRFVNGKSDACDYAWFYWGSRRHAGIYFL